MKDVVREKKLAVWNEKANVDFDRRKNEFWAFIGRRTKVRNASLIKERGRGLVTSTNSKGKLDTFQKHLGV